MISHADLAAALCRIPQGESGDIRGVTVHRESRREYAVAGGAPQLLLPAMDAVAALAGLHAVPDEPQAPEGLPGLREALTAAAERHVPLLEPPTPRSPPDPAPPRRSA
jgi:hypothetical protein